MARTNTSNWPPRFGYVGVGVHRRRLTEGGYRGALPIGGGCCPFQLLCVVQQIANCIFNKTNSRG